MSLTKKRALLNAFLFENEASRIGHTRYYLPTVEIKNYSVMINGRKIFDQSVKSDIRAYENIRAIFACQGDDARLATY